jgi:hypothetical protein
MAEDRSIFRNVTLVDRNELTLLGDVDGKYVRVGCLLIQPGTALRYVGDRGVLVIPHWLVVDLGLVSSARTHRPLLETEPLAARPGAAR